MINTQVSSGRLKLFRYLINDEFLIKKCKSSKIARSCQRRKMSSENYSFKRVFTASSARRKIWLPSLRVFSWCSLERRLNPFFLNNFWTSRVKIARKNENTFLASNLNYEKYSLTCLELTRFFQCCGLPPELGTVRGFPHSSRDHLIYSLMDHISSTDH